MKKNNGQASVEYLVVTAMLLLALLTPFGDENQNVLERCTTAVTDWYQAFAFSKSQPELPRTY